jgi:ribosomal protein L7/L12
MKISEIENLIQKIDEELESIQPELKKLFVKKRHITKRDILLDAKKQLINDLYELKKEAGLIKRLYLINPGDLKINVIKLICDHSDLGLKEAKELVDKAPVEITKINPGEEKTLKEKLCNITKGCEAEFRN